jgi:nitroreductase
MDALLCLKTRRSIRTFSPSDIPAHVVDDLLEAARLAPTAMNRQPWTFLVMRDAQTRSRIVEIAGHAEFLRTSPVAVAVCVEEWDYWKEDGSAAIMAMLLAAHAHGLGACWVSMEPHAYAQGVKALLGVPEGVHLLAVVALGHPAEEPAPEKKPMAGMVKQERW